MIKRTAESLFEASKKIVPGGVHSPVRSFKGLPVAPRFIEKAEGATITDTEGKNYIDFCMSFGPLILGHQNPVVKNELKTALDRGWSYGACEPYSLALADFLTSKLPFIDQIRFVNSGTEAVMTALRLARGVTKRSKILKFNGCYHGHVDSMLIKAGSGLAGTSTASSAGIPEGISRDTLIVELDDESAVTKCFQDHPDQIAAIIVEPLPANNGLLPQRQEFLKFLRELTKKNGTLLIFDEVISGFRVAFGGMAELTGITPDIVTYGKIIGGGLPVGAIAAKKSIMEHLAPIGPVYQAGTLSANPLAMVGGLATLKQLNDKQYEQLEINASLIHNTISEWLLGFDNGRFKDIKMVRFGSLFWFISKDGIRSIDQIPSSLSSDFEPLFMTLLQKGIYLAPNAWEVGFVSLAHTQEVVDELKKRLWN
ncbi:MAG: glutamate-1-semialdehyde 2,1-aminomutase [Bdellovibrio sp.]